MQEKSEQYSDFYGLHATIFTVQTLYYAKEKIDHFILSYNTPLAAMENNYSWEILYLDQRKTCLNFRGARLGCDLRTECWKKTDFLVFKSFNPYRITIGKETGV